MLAHGYMGYKLTSLNRFGWEEVWGHESQVNKSEKIQGDRSQVGMGASEV